MERLATEVDASHVGAEMGYPIPDVVVDGEVIEAGPDVAPPHGPDLGAAGW